MRIKQHLLFVFIVFFIVFNKSAYSEKASKSALTAVYIVKFAENVTWPNIASKKAFRIQILAPDKKLEKELKKIALKTTLKNKNIEIINSNDSRLKKDIQLLYVAESADVNIEGLLPQLASTNTLLVTEGFKDERLVMINLKSNNAKEEGLRFEINRANIINQELTVSPNIILLGGTEIDVARLYREGQTSLFSQKQSMKRLQAEREQLQHSLSLNKTESKQLQKEINYLKISLKKQKALNQKETDKLQVLSSKISLQTKEIADQKFQLNKQNDALTEEHNKYQNVLELIKEKERVLKLNDKKVKDRLVLINKQDSKIASQQQILSKQSQTIIEQKNLILITLVSAILMGLMAIFSYKSYLSKQRANKNLKLLTTQLKDSKIEADRANQSKSTFLANMSHELRTPLNAILGFSQLLERKPPEADKLNADLRTINRAGEHLLHIINDVLDMSKIEAGAIKLEEESFDIGSLLLELVNMMRIRAESKGLSLTLEQSSSFPRFIYGDQIKIRQILINLLGNAIKFTDKGGVTLSLDADISNNEKDVLLKFQVIDSGIGIPVNLQSDVFKPFEQASHTYGLNTGQKGTGLGMAITQQFVHLMQGEIYLESELGKGTTVFFNVKVNMSQEVYLQEQVHKKKVIAVKNMPNKVKVLIVEDQPDSAALLERVVQSIGMETKIANNGKAAVDLFSKWQPDFIWMDRRMPIMDGLEATKIIREQTGGEHVKIVALTASALKEETERIMQCGFDKFLAKPYKIETIYEVMKELLNLEYEYEQEKSSSAFALEAIKINKEKLNRLDFKIRHKLYIAAVELNSDKVIEVAESIYQDDEETAQVLKQLAIKFEFEQLIEVLELIDKPFH